jgi:cation-dependent mannose-6-phosphate receptor
MQTSPSLIGSLFLFFLSTSTFVTAYTGSNLAPKSPEKPCTIYSPTTGSYFDLNHISISPPEIKDGKKVYKDGHEESWHAKGYDYGANFTINICAPVIEDISDVVGVDKSRWKNVSAYYTMDDRIYSIGSVSILLI